MVAIKYKVQNELGIETKFCLTGATNFIDAMTMLYDNSPDYEILSAVITYVPELIDINMENYCEIRGEYGIFKEQ